MINLYIVTLSCILISRHDHVISFISIYFKSNPFTSNHYRFCVFLHSMYASTQYINIININQKMMRTISFHAILVYPTFLMAYSKAKMKSSSDKASSCFKPFLIGNMSDKFCLPRLCYRLHSDTIVLTLLVSIVNIMYDLPPKWIIGFLESIYSGCTASLYSHFFSSIWQMQNIWLLVELLAQNPHLWLPIITSSHGINLDSRMLDNILYVVDKKWYASVTILTICFITLLTDR